MSNSEFKFCRSHCDQPLKCAPSHAGRQIQPMGCNPLIRIPYPPAGASSIDDARNFRRQVQ